ncbi:hypothetical protein AAC387_Pa11g1069 [Persea americana]
MAVLFLSEELEEREVISSATGFKGVREGEWSGRCFPLCLAHQRGRASKSLDREFASLALARKVVGDRIPVFHVKSSRLSVTGELLHTSGKEGFSDPFRFEIAGTEGREMGDKVYHRKGMKREDSKGQLGQKYSNCCWSGVTF